MTMTRSQIVAANPVLLQASGALMDALIKLADRQPHLAEMYSDDAQMYLERAVRELGGSITWPALERHQEEQAEARRED